MSPWAFRRPTGGAEIIRRAPVLVGMVRLGTGVELIVSSLLLAARPPYLAARLKRDHPQIAEAVERGELSANAAAVERGRLRLAPFIGGCLRAYGSALFGWSLRLGAFFVPLRHSGAFGRPLLFRRPHSSMLNRRLCQPTPGCIRPNHSAHERRGP